MTILRSLSTDFHPEIPDEMLRAALGYAERGIPAFPCRPAPDKSPLTRHGFKDATTDPEQIGAWWNRHPEASVGVPTGVRFWVLDEDRPGALDELEREHGELPRTYTVRTPRGGRHKWFRAAEGITNSTGRLPEGIDVRGKGGYVLVPPSPGYTVSTDLPVAPAPDWLMELVRTPRQRLTVHEGQGQGEVTRSRFQLPERILESMPSRNRTLFGYGCSLRAHGWDHPAILEELLAANAERCVPPLSDAEVRKVARSAAGYEPGNASTVAPEVVEAVAFVEEKAGARPKKGTAPHSRWAAYRALLDCAKEHGWMHGRERPCATAAASTPSTQASPSGPSTEPWTHCTTQASSSPSQAAREPRQACSSSGCPEGDSLTPLVPPESHAPLLVSARHLRGRCTASGTGRGASAR